MKLDLKAYRCPVAQIYANRALMLFLDSEAETLTIESIEPALLPNLLARVAASELKVTLDVISERTVGPDDLVRWGAEFDEDDLEDAAGIKMILISRITI